MRKRTYKILFYFTLILILAATVLKIINIHNNTKNSESDSLVSLEYIDAKSYIVLDVKSKRILDGKNIDSLVLPASTTKILTCLTVLNNFNLDEYITITKEMINVEGSKIYLKEKDVISVENLLYGLMLNSGNDASLALAIGLTGSVDNFVKLMNDECKIIGMTNSTFENPNGLDTFNKNYTTAYDMAILMANALKNESFRKITSCKEKTVKLESGNNLYFNNKHKLIHTNDLTTGGKTGYTKKAGRTLVTSFKQDDFEIVVCTFDASNDWEIHKDLANKVFNKYHQEKLIKKYNIYEKTNRNIKINNKDLLFPLTDNEQKDQFYVIIKELDKKLVIKYYKEEEQVGYLEVLYD